MIRAATVEDAAALAAVEVGAMLAGYAEFADDLGALPSVVEEVAEWRAVLRDPEGRRTWLAADVDAVIGLVSCSPGRLDELMVLPDRWGAGVGSALLRHGEDALRAAGTTSATVHVYAANARARGLYERHGWRLDGDAPPLVLGPQVRYRKELAG